MTVHTDGSPSNLSEQTGDSRGHKANPLVPNRGWAGQKHWQEGWEACAQWFFERLREDPVSKVHADATAILEIRHAGKGGKRRPKQLRRDNPVLPALIRRFRD